MSRRVVIWRWIVRPLALGVVTTVGVAWGLAAWLPQRDWDTHSYSNLDIAGDNYWLMLNEYWTRGAVRRSWSRGRFGALRFPPFLTAIDTGRGGAVDFAGDPLRGGNWGRANEARAAPLAGPADGCEHATGWPFLAGWYELEARWDAEYEPKTQIIVRGGIPLQGIHQGPAIFPRASSIRALPWRPIWWGLIADVAVYGASWLVLLGGIGAGVKARRRRLGRCIGCGYDLRGLAAGADCPECGRTGRVGGGPSPAAV